jgi:peptide/nickel transport system permease protein
MRYLLRRLLFYIVAAFVAITLNFMVPRLMAGDPVQLMFAQFQGRLDPRAMESLKETFGFVSGPIGEQYVTYLKNLLQGNLGLSVSAFPTPVADLIGPSLGWTIRLIGSSTIIAFTLGSLLGIFAAWKRGGKIDSLLLPVVSTLGAFPFFWIALLMLYTFAFTFKIFPIGHAYDVSFGDINWGNAEHVNSVIQHMILPMFTIIFTGLGGWLLGMRNNMIGILAEDYVTMAQAKGLSDRRVMFIYAARNAILPSITAFSMSLGFAVGGALIVELVFAYPGMGYTLLRAVQGRDYPLMQGVFLFITLAVLAANFMADVFYVMLDPRAR